MPLYILPTGQGGIRDILPNKVTNLLRYY